MAGYGFRLEAARPDERLKRRYNVKSEDLEMTPPFSTNLFPEHLRASPGFHLLKPEKPAQPLEGGHGLAPSLHTKISSEEDAFNQGEDGLEVSRRTSVLKPEHRLTCPSLAALAESIC